MKIIVTSESFSNFPPLETVVAFGKLIIKFWVLIKSFLRKHQLCLKDEQGMDIKTCVRSDLHQNGRQPEKITSQPFQFLASICHIFFWKTEKGRLLQKREKAGNFLKLWQQFRKS